MYFNKVSCERLFLSKYEITQNSHLSNTEEKKYEKVFFPSHVMFQMLALLADALIEIREQVTMVR